MKKVTLLIIFLFAGSCLKAQKYVPFPDSNASWEVAYYSEINCGPPSYYCYTLQYFIKGDTVINSAYYHKLCYVPIDQYYTVEYEGAIRQDTSLKQIYYVADDHSGQEHLLWDFNLNIGDTIVPTYWNGTKCWVTGIDTIIIGGIARKKYLLDAYYVCNNCYLLEGIGSSSGPIGSIGYFEGGSYLICFNQDDTIYYSPYGNCEIVHDPGIEELKRNNISISPNPFSSTTQITLSQTYHNISFSVYDIQGKLVSQNQYKDSDKITLNRNNFNNGMYFLKLILDEKEVATGKIVVSD